MSSTLSGWLINKRTHLDADPGSWVGALEVIDELGEILNGVNVVMGGRGNEANTRGGVTSLCDISLDLSTWQLATLTGLCSLRI